MSGVKFTLTGTENIRKIFAEFPEKGYRRPIMAGFTKAAVPVKRGMIASIPSYLKGISKAIKIVPYKSPDPMLSVGVFSRGIVYRNKRGINWNPFQLSLWHNYGTLDWRANRFHQFKSPVRKKITSDSMGGIKPKLFIERGWEENKKQAQTIFEDVVDKEIIKFFEKEAAK